MLLPLSDAGWDEGDGTLQPARRGWCHRRLGESERPGHERREGLPLKLDPHLPPFPGQLGVKTGLVVGQWLLSVIWENLFS